MGTVCKAARDAATSDCSPPTGKFFSRKKAQKAQNLEKGMSVTERANLPYQDSPLFSETPAFLIPLHFCAVCAFLRLKILRPLTGCIRGADG
jgi:hypothetical protein